MKLPRSRRARLAGIVGLSLVALVAGLAAAGDRRAPVAGGPLAPASSIGGGQAAEADRSEAAREVAGGKVAAEPAATLPDVPLAWRRIAAAAKRWPAPTDRPRLGDELPLPTVPASRVRDAIGVNIDVWRTEYGYRDFAPVIAKVAELQLRHARAPVSAVDGPGLERMQALGEIGVRWNVLLGDAFGRYGLAPLATLDRRLDTALLPYTDSAEGTNEPDLAGREDWVQEARRHQRAVARAIEGERGDPLALVAPSVGRLGNVAALGNLDGLADAGNAHAYASGDEPSKALDDWLALMVDQLPDAPMLVTEAGFQTDLRQRKYHTPTSPKAAAIYTPRLILEAIRRGIPRVYLYELIDRWNDPFGIDTAAHFGLLEHDLTPKPAWHSLLRLQRTLLDDGRPDRTVTPLRSTISAAPPDLRTLAFRRRDGSAALAVWRGAPVWDAAAAADLDVPAEPVTITLPSEQRGVAAIDLVTGHRSDPARGNVLTVSLGGHPVVLTGLRDR